MSRRCGVSISTRRAGKRAGLAWAQRGREDDRGSDSDDAAQARRRQRAGRGFDVARESGSRADADRARRPVRGRRREPERVREPRMVGPPLPPRPRASRHGPRAARRLRSRRRGKRLVRTYSGGMRRRLDLAAALVARPPILFLDEPTTGLDIRSRLSLWDALEALVARGTTVLLTTQYLDEADRLAHRIAVVNHGVVIAEGTPDALKRQVGGIGSRSASPTASLARRRHPAPSRRSATAHLPIDGWSRYRRGRRRRHRRCAPPWTVGDRDRGHRDSTSRHSTTCS